MRWSRARSAALGLAAALLVGVAAPACGTGSQTGDAPGDLGVDVVFGLRRDQQGLSHYALEVNDPFSPMYGAFLSATEVAERYGASANDLAQATDLLEARGFDVSVDVTGGFLSAAMSVDEARELLGVGFDLVPVQGDRQVLRPIGTPQAPELIGAVTAEIVGLAELVPAEVPPPRPPEASALVPPADQCAETSQQIEAVRDRYGFTRLRGGGAASSVAVLATERFDQSEQASLHLLATCLGRPAMEPEVVDLVHGRTVDGFSEVDLDLETLVALLPGLEAMHVVQMDPFDWIGSALAAALDASRTGGALVDAVVTSIDFCEGDMTEADVELAEYVLSAAAAMGVTVVASAGDAGSSGCYPPQKEEMFAQYPASSWFVTGVGGTQLSQGPDGVASESVWFDAAGTFAGGGAPSRMLGVPAYQSEVLDGDQRGTPDLAVLAAPNDVPVLPFCDHDGSCRWEPMGGTSFGAPMAAAGLVAAGKAAEATGKVAPALWNPLLYSTYRGRAPAITDVVSGANDLFGLGCCEAVEGYDEASGLGSPDFSKLTALVPWTAIRSR